MKKTKEVIESPERQFCKLCREGRLFETEAWLKAGKPANFEHKNVRCTPLGIAIASNFHSLLEVLLKNGLKATVKHFWLAIRLGRVGMIELMIQHGVEPNWLNFRDVVDWPNPKILKIFIEQGSDTYTGFPVAEALKRAPRAFLGLYKSYADKFPDWKLQADIALRYFCEEGKLQGVCLMLWAGANPRHSVPSKWGEEPELWTSSLWQACICGHAEIVRKIGPNREQDDLDDLLCIAGNGCSAELISYLIGLGANPNARTKRDGVLRSALWRLNGELDNAQYCSYSSRYSKALDVLKRLTELGCRLDPSTKDEIQFLRECFIRMKSNELIELMPFLLQHNFAERKIFLNLMEIPLIRAQYNWHQPKLYRLFPELKPKKNG